MYPSKRRERGQEDTHLAFVPGPGDAKCHAWLGGDSNSFFWERDTEIKHVILRSFPLWWKDATQRTAKRVFGGTQKADAALHDWNTRLQAD